MKYDIPTMTAEAVSLLKSLISIPSISREETQAADFLQNYIEAEGMQTGRKGNNVWCLSPMFDLKKPTILLNSHFLKNHCRNFLRSIRFTFYSYFVVCTHVTFNRNDCIFWVGYSLTFSQLTN